MPAWMARERMETGGSRTVPAMGTMGRLRRWIDRRKPLLPVLFAEFVILLGFGSLLPVLPLYVVQHGVDIPTLGFITAAWPLAKLISEPTFGYLADRTGRHKPIMLAGLALLSVFTVLPLVFTSAPAFFLLRFLSGAAAGMYDPAARGIIVDVTAEGERGEAFGLYSASQMGGFLIGPVLGSLGAALGGGYAFPFVFTGVLTLGAGLYLWRFLADHPVAFIPQRSRPAASTRVDVIATSREVPLTTPAVRPATAEAEPVQAPLAALLNRPFAAAVVMYFGVSLAFGVYDVIWTLYMTRLGASIELVGLTFTLFGLGVMLLSPLAGRVVDRVGAMRFAVGGILGIACAGVLYTLATEPVFPTLVVPFESIAEAFAVPALFALVALGSPPGRTSTAQGVFGAAGTIALVIASAAGGILWSHDPTWPFWMFVVGAVACLFLGLALRGFRRGAAAVESERTRTAEA